MIDGQALPAPPATPGAGGDGAGGDTPSEPPRNYLLDIQELSLNSLYFDRTEEAPSSRSAKGSKAKKSKKAKRDAPSHKLQLLCDIDPESKEGQGMEF